MQFFLQLSSEQRVSFLHTGQLDPRHNDRWSIIGWNPTRSITQMEDLPRSQSNHHCNLPFCGGFIGVFSYDKGDDTIPLVSGYEYDQFLCYDQLSKQLFTSAPQTVMGIWQRQSPSDPLVTPITFAPEWTREQYRQAFNKIKEYILDGDIYQVNLSYRWRSAFNGSRRQLFAVLCQKNPATMSSYIEGDGFEVLSCSPERFLSLDGRRVQTMPIKGTRPRGQTPEQDQQLRKELLASPKETAELAMITDLLRNDIGQVCEIGSIAVKEFRSLQQCPTVWHTYSVVEGTLRQGLGAIDLLTACFPGGSVTGCPKQRAMEIIQEVEQTPRGPYTGTVFLLSRCGKMDSSIVIRTLVATAGTLMLHVGGGIVVDSDCEQEYQETLDKAAAFLSL